jgi:hypothetical protein
MMANGVKGAENTPIDVHDNKAPHISSSPVLSSSCVSGLIEEGMQPRRSRVRLRRRLLGRLRELPPVESDVNHHRERD